jgi:N-acetylglucosamine transport system substrate-binding protein
MTKNKRLEVSRREFMQLAAVAGGSVALGSRFTGVARAQDTEYGGPLQVEKATIEMQIREQSSKPVSALDAIRDQLQEMYTETEWNMVYQQQWDTLRLRLIAGDPPDGAWLNVAGNPWVLLDEGLLAPLTPLMDAPAYGQEGLTFKDTFLPGMLEPGQKDGVQYLIPRAITLCGFWYNKALAARKGWTIPQELGAWTWDDFTALMDTIMGDGLYPILTGDAVVFYWALFLNFVFQAGGPEQYEAMNHLDEGAWSNDVIIAALQRSNELFRKGYIDPMWNRLPWGDGAALYLLGESVFYPDDTWSVLQYADQAPVGFEMSFTPVPVIPEAKFTKVIQGIPKPDLFVPRDAKHPNGAMEYFRLWLSQSFSGALAERGFLVPIQGAEVPDTLNPTIQDMLAYFHQAEYYYNPMFQVWYQPLAQAANGAFTSMALGDISPEEAAQKMEAAAQTVRDDSSIPKH